MTASGQENKSKNTQEVKNERFFNIDKIKTRCEFSAYVAFYTVTNGQTDVYKKTKKSKRLAKCHC